MKLIFANCEVYYNGRSETELEAGYRLIIIKDDNSVSIHQDCGYKPINYMNNTKTIDYIYDDNNLNNLIEIVIKSKTEIINVKINNVDLQLEKPLEKELKAKFFWTEKQIQDWLLNDKNFKKTFGNNTKLIEKEFNTTEGSCDLLGFNETTKNIILIELKRTVVKNNVYQILRYKQGVKNILARMKENNAQEYKTTHGNIININSLKTPELILAGLKIMDGTEKTLNKNNIEFKQVKFIQNR